MVFGLDAVVVTLDGILVRYCCCRCVLILLSLCVDAVVVVVC